MKIMHWIWQKRKCLHKCELPLRTSCNLSLRQCQLQSCGSCTSGRQTQPLPGRDTLPMAITLLPKPWKRHAQSKKENVIGRSRSYEYHIRSRNRGRQHVFSVFAAFRNRWGEKYFISQTNIPICIDNMHIQTK